MKEELKKLLEKVYSGHFGTKNRVELIIILESLISKNKDL